MHTYLSFRTFAPFCLLASQCHAEYGGNIFVGTNKSRQMYCFCVERGGL